MGAACWPSRTDAASLFDQQSGVHPWRRPRGDTQSRLCKRSLEKVLNRSQHLATAALPRRALTRRNERGAVERCFKGPEHPRNQAYTGQELPHNKPHPHRVGLPLVVGVCIYKLGPPSGPPTSYPSTTMLSAKLTHTYFHLLLCLLNVCVFILFLEQERPHVPRADVYFTCDSDLPSPDSSLMSLTALFQGF